MEAIARTVSLSRVPIVAKETGGGISRETARRLADVGVAALDTGGRGGTSFAAIEAERSRIRGDRRRSELGTALSHWGIPTAVSVAACSPILPTIAVGGVRSGLDAAKAMSLGARVVGVGRPLLECAVEGEDSLQDWFDDFCLQLRSAMFLSGASRCVDLLSVPRVILGETAQWIHQLD
jgi:isopentenyl-diphosphate delta-isomerase